MLNLHVVEGAVWYPPNIGDNRSKKAAEQFALLVDPMNGQELAMDELVYVKGLTKENGDGESKPMDHYRVMRNAVMIRHIKQIRNCFFSVRKNGKPETQEIKTPEEMIDVCARSNNDDILQTIYGEIKSHSTLAENMMGNSDLRFDSATQETSDTPAGGAPSVKVRSLPTKITSEESGDAMVKRKTQSLSSGHPN